MIDESLFRVVNVVASFMIAGTLSWRHFYYLKTYGFDDRLRTAVAVGVFAWIGVSSGVALGLDLPLPFTVKISTLLLTLYLVSLWTPWRWHERRR